MAPDLPVRRSRRARSALSQPPDVTTPCLSLAASAADQRLCLPLPRTKIPPAATALVSATGHRPHWSLELDTDPPGHRIRPPRSPGHRIRPLRSPGHRIRPLRSPGHRSHRAGHQVRQETPEPPATRFPQDRLTEQHCRRGRDGAGVDGAAGPAAAATDIPQQVACSGHS